MSNHIKERGKRLSLLRYHFGISQLELGKRLFPNLAEKSGQMAVSHLETGKKKMKIYQTEDAAVLFGVKESFFDHDKYPSLLLPVLASTPRRFPDAAQEVIEPFQAKHPLLIAKTRPYPYLPTFWYDHQREQRKNGNGNGNGNGNAKRKAKKAQKIQVERTENSLKIEVPINAISALLAEFLM